MLVFFMSKQPTLGWGVLLASLFLVGCGAEPGTSHKSASSLDNESQKLAYFLGYQMAIQFQNSPVTVDKVPFYQGFSDALSSKTSSLSDAEQQVALATITRIKQQSTPSIEDLKILESKAQAYLENQREQRGMQRLESGLLYRVLAEGEVKRPTADSRVLVNYHGTLVDGALFHSSEEAGPVEFSVSQVIPAWRQVLVNMPVGSRWQLIVPPELGFGVQGAGDWVGPHEVLLYEIELTEIL